MTTRIQVRLSEASVTALDAVIASGRFASRSDAIRAGLEFILRQERKREIDEAYARGYAQHPQEEWVGDLGMACLAASGIAEEL